MSLCTKVSLPAFTVGLYNGSTLVQSTSTSAVDGSYSFTNVPAGTYSVRGVGMGLENATVEAGQKVKLKLVVHYDTPLRPYKRRLPAG